MDGQARLSGRRGVLGHIFIPSYTGIFIFTGLVTVALGLGTAMYLLVSQEDGRPIHFLVFQVFGMIYPA
jgi:hypothetical protein